MLFFARKAADEPRGLVLTPSQAARQRSQRLKQVRLAGRVAARLLAAIRRGGLRRR